MKLVEADPLSSYPYGYRRNSRTCSIGRAWRSTLSMLIFYPNTVCSEDTEFTVKLSAFVASVWTQVHAAVAVGLPVDDESRSSSEHETCTVVQSTRHTIRSLDDYSGHQTRNGLGSLDIGAVRSRIDE